MDLTNEQWKLVETILPPDAIRDDGRGRPWTDKRTVLNGILWILRTGAPWKDMPDRYGSYQTAHRRFQNWVRSGVFEKLLFTLAQHLKDAGTKIMGVADGHGLPLALRAESATPAEVKLVEHTLAERFVAEVPERLIGDKAYDSDGLDQKLMQNYGTEMIAPNKSNRRIKTQDGRPLRRFARRWKIERLFAWLFNFRRLVVRYEYHADNFQGFIHLAAAVILLRYL